jgi:hypothetical protein
MVVRYEFSFSLYGCVLSKPPSGLIANFKVDGDRVHRTGSPFDLKELGLLKDASINFQYSNSTELKWYK